MTKISVLLISISIFFGYHSKAQKHSKFQASFVSPIGTNGLESRYTSNDYSFNLLMGTNGGLRKMEIGGLANVNSGAVSGFQMAGIANINAEKTKGFNLAGTCNLLAKNAEGFQLAGVCNIVGKEAHGVLISGASNISQESASGFQLAPLNLVGGNFSGVQLGVFNQVKSLKGMQIGIVNISDSTENATPFGIFSIVKGGYYALELSYSQSMQANLSYKMGVEHLYTIFTFGFDNYKNKDLFRYGLGFGSMLSLGKTHKLALEATCSQLVYDNSWDDLNLLNRLKTNFHMHVSPDFALFAGPTFNVYITDKKIGEKYGTIDMPHSIYDHESSKNKLFMWIGFNAGISFTF
ncbi:LA_2272 family surface repeat-containing protein [Marinifilum caeruleilacunae]|uniref:DUF3308 domain-containing protein n=1 Tax=Marinifilum caeruleilacunae TaxID=2499076 RepID=A0ABX1X0H0_9BACT|nr:hypothetical protein [Marinifilum caeruleilacunae]NOU61901.1 hypothetical protein [Marinifilum caeruleilacunae]